VYQNYKVDLHLEIKKNDVISNELDELLSNHIENRFKDYKQQDKSDNQQNNNEYDDMPGLISDNDVINNEFVELVTNHIENRFKDNKDYKQQNDNEYDDMPGLISDNDERELNNFNEFPSPILDSKYIKVDDDMLKILSSQNL